MNQYIYIRLLLYSSQLEYIVAMHRWVILRFKRLLILHNPSQLRALIIERIIIIGGIGPRGKEICLYWFQYDHMFIVFDSFLVLTDLREHNILILHVAVEGLLTLQ